MTNSTKTRCRAKSKQTGEQCRNWAKPGYPVCRFHGAGGRPNIVMPKRPPTAHAPKGNQNARKHGAYTLNLLPEEKIAYDQLVEKYTSALGEKLDAFDEQLVEQLALFSVKVFSTVSSGAPPEAVTPYARLVMEHMRELKATRASKDSSGLTGNTPAEVMAALFMKVSGGKKSAQVPATIDVAPTKVEALPPCDPEESSESSGEGD